MTMTKKDYELIEKAISHARQHVNGMRFKGQISGEQATEMSLGVAYVEGSLINVLREANPKFDEEKFSKGCRAYGLFRGFSGDIEPRAK